MNYLTIPQIMKMTGKSDSAVRRALKAAEIPLQKPEGAKGYRIPERQAVSFISRQWPESIARVAV